MKRLLLILGLTQILLTNCKPADNKDQMNLELITDLIDKEEGFEDIGLRITDKIIDGDKIIFIGQGLFDGDTVGLKFETWKEYGAGVTPDGELNSKTGYTHESVKFYSLGQQSDNLIKALGKLYSLPTDKSFANTAVTASAFSLSSHHADLTKSTGYFKSKLFIQENSDELYCEIYFNINLDKGTIELPEKDLEYRENLINAFTKQ